ncbi:UDP-N-acetylglucosamine--N-acetylmuramyl-(pentapeptide) pyrophosphoryl-undecaprenol N-acetylglucosamine transferase [Fluviispira multicolorata]|uniref:UDP-N-acetylglucosamine--N-acetylmuramyl-(pentapeptide) pyrophosphoryl-undecaprenol N-acetylglucosamine transferase n=1 Tax=Fluviispira multicolorata TaxID=2654512 RepID=A0A833JDB1_9BACT|nr:UDP-N-acetylglucosamine--N-acetylmuramyl-(pentapeptide) pyrophosphoryl-undecaprenol N-acetylglucosamine transferase [Fluviispira multicolorata]KAB8028142.1 UDP-N-acetylglucosamine--N-acetylmuramyl-(pentapeptide) pyrophosphoryl-undecaprenol N-acetylglucosamine transferase [Fluviispira multicolorata]
MKDNNKRYVIVLTGGGTAGHVWPHFALFEGEKSPLANAFRENKLSVHYIGSQSGMEKDLVLINQPNWTYHSVATGKLRRYFSLKNFSDIFKIIFGFLQAFFLLGKIKASVVFSKGGFVSAPVVWAAWLRGVPIVIHESDATPALATKLTLPFSFLALVAFAETIPKMPPLFQKRVKHVGLPIRESLFSASKNDSLKFFNLESNKKTILIFGGSLGAQSLNNKMFNIIPELNKQFNIIHIVGKGNKSEIMNVNHYRQYEFLNQEMKYAYAAADLAICRAGASSIFELAAARVPMILVPLGLHASRGDQIVNARIFTNQGWAQIIDENTFQNESAIQLIESTMNSLDERKKALDSSPSAQTASKVSELIWDIILRYEANK